MTTHVERLVKERAHAKDGDMLVFLTGATVSVIVLAIPAVIFGITRS